MKKILVIPGDGIGPEVMTHAKKLLAVLNAKRKLEFCLNEVDWGAERWLKEKVGIPEGELELIPERYDAILFGALGDPRIADMAHGRAILLRLRMELDLYVNLRPVELLHESLGVLKQKENTRLDMMIFRENTQDLYGGAGGTLQKGSAHEIAIDESVHSYRGVERIIRAAFSYAIQNQRKKVTLVDKSNAIQFGGRLWTRVFKEVARDYSHICAEHLYVDVAAMYMVQNPSRFDVMVTSNLFGDILSDLGAGLCGGLGLAASANLNPGRIALFEPVHGSAPDIAGLGRANPIAMFLSVALMMNYFDYYQEAQAIKQAVITTLALGQTTPDLGGALSSEEAAAAIISYLTF